MATISVDNNRSQGNNNPNDPLLQDESSGPQTGTDPTNVADGNEVDVTLNGSNQLTLGLSAGFLTYLNGLGLTLAQKTFVATNDAASSISNFITATPGANETITDLFFSADPNNATGLIAGVTTLALEPLYLHIDSNNNFAFITTASDNTGRIVAAFALVSEASNQQGVFTAGVQTVTFEALFHTDPTQADEPINWTDTLRISAATKIEINFNAVPSGDHLWVAAGSADGGVLVTSDHIVVDGSEKKTNANEDIHTSKGGGQVTIGVINQLFDHDGETAYFTLVKHLTTLTSAAGAGGDYLVDPTPNDNKLEGIDYGLAGTNLDAYVNTNGAGIFLSQSQGSPTNPKDLDINVFRAGGGTTAEDGANYDDGLASDTSVDVATVTILNGTTPVGTWVFGEASNGTTQNGVKVTISGNNIDVGNVNVGYTINWTVTAGQTFNRFTVTNEQYEAGSSYFDTNNEHIGAFDIGKILINDTQGISAGLGSHLFVEDDGASLSGTLRINVDEDELSTAAPGAGDPPADTSNGITDNDAATDEAYFLDSALAALVSGTDAPAVFALNTTVLGGLDGTNVLGVDGLVVKSQGGTVVYDVIDANTINGVVGGRIVFTLSRVDDDVNNIHGFLFDLRDQIDHADASTDTGFRDLNLGPAFTLTDKDLDPAAIGNAIQVRIENDVPTAKPNTFATEEVHEDALPGGNTPDPGDSETKVVTVTYTKAELTALANVGADNDLTFSLNTAGSGTLGAIIGTNVVTTGGANVQSKGVNVMWAAGAAGSLKGIVTVLGVDTTIFTLTPSGDDFVFTLLEQVDHSAGNDDLELLALDLTSAFKAVDFDKDPLTLNPDSVVLNVENDLPIFTAQIASKTLDWVDDAFVTGSLFGKVGGDDTGSYIIDKYTNLADYTESLSLDGKTLTYSKDGKIYFTLALDDTANGGAGGYTFTINEPPADQVLELNFEDLDSGQNLFGTIAFDKNSIDNAGTPGDPSDDFLPDGGLLTFPSNPDINDGEDGEPGPPPLESTDGTMTSQSGTTNTSKGGGPVTIGNTNQAFDHPEEGAWFCYVDEPQTTAVSGVGLDPNLADDADNIQFNGMVDVRKASVELVQASGAGTTKRPGPAVHIETWDLNPGLVDDSSESRAFLLDPTATGVKANIIAIKIYDENGDLIEYRTNLQGGATNIGALAGGTTNSPVVIQFNLDDNGGTVNDFTDDTYSVNVSNLKANYTIEWETEGDHNAALVQNVSGSYDIGGFNILQGHDALDVDLEFSVAIEDKDGDIDHFNDPTDVFDDFKIKIDGTGANNDPNNVPPTGFATSYDTPADVQTLFAAASLKDPGFVNDSGMGPAIGPQTNALTLKELHVGLGPSSFDHENQLQRLNVELFNLV